jgi:hypothetical protein
LVEVHARVDGLIDVVDAEAGGRFRRRRGLSKAAEGGADHEDRQQTEKTHGWNLLIDDAQTEPPILSLSGFDEQGFDEPGVEK